MDEDRRPVGKEARFTEPGPVCIRLIQYLPTRLHLPDTHSMCASWPFSIRNRVHKGQTICPGPSSSGRGGLGLSPATLCPRGARTTVCRVQAVTCKTVPLPRGCVNPSWPQGRHTWERRCRPDPHHQCLVPLCSCTTQRPNSNPHQLNNTRVREWCWWRPSIFSWVPQRECGQGRGWIGQLLQQYI